MARTRNIRPATPSEAVRPDPKTRAGSAGEGPRHGRRPPPPPAVEPDAGAHPGPTVTGRRPNESEKQTYQRRLRSLAVETTLADHRERQRIASALHDNLGQVLALARIKLGALAKVTGATPAVKEIQELLAQAVQQTRSLTRDLSPPVLDSLGLGAAIEWLAEQNSRNGLKVDATAYPVPPQLREDVKVLLFQAARELLRNVTRHAKATRAAVTLRVRAGHVEMSVRDNGVGSARPPDDATPVPREGFGLFGIRARFQHFGGTMEIDTGTRGGGTGAGAGGLCVTLTVPLNPSGPRPPRTAGRAKAATGPRRRPKPIDRTDAVGPHLR